MGERPGVRSGVVSRGSKDCGYHGQVVELGDVSSQD